MGAEHLHLLQVHPAHIQCWSVCQTEHWYYLQVSKPLMLDDQVVAQYSVRMSMCSTCTKCVQKYSDVRRAPQVGC